MVQKFLKILDDQGDNIEKNTHRKNKMSIFSLTYFLKYLFCNCKMILNKPKIIKKMEEQRISSKIYDFMKKMIQFVPQAFFFK